MPLRRSALALLVACLVAGIAPPHSASALQLGFNDGESFQWGLSPDQRAIALAHAQSAGASLIRLSVNWNGVDLEPPQSSAQARDPNWDGYRWGALDTQVRAVVAAGMEPLVVADGLQSVPGWFEGPGRPEPSDAARPGTWRPNATAFGDFGYALATRYSGSFTHDGAVLPRVRYFQAYNEPNLPEYLSPQWVGTSPASPDAYRAMLNSFYDGVKAVHPDDVVVSAALAPYGDPPVGRRLPPLYFARRLLCIDGDVRLRARHCPPVKFDVFSYNAYPFEDPRLPAGTRDNVRLTADDYQHLLRMAAAAGTITRSQARNVWVTELGWDVEPAFDPPPWRPVTPDVQARFLATALALLWRDRVGAVFWFNLRDYETITNFTTGSGLFRWSPDVRTDQPKPAYTAFRFPLTGLLSGRRTQVWGRAPAPGRVVLERGYRSGAWRPLATLRAGRDLVFTTTKRLPLGAQLRAVQGSATSLTWSVERLDP